MHRGFLKANMRICRKEHLPFIIATVFVIAIFIKNSWVSEDAYILFRSLEQLFAGNGPVWNPHERVQVFTSPLWYILLAIIRVFSGDYFLNSILLSLALLITVLIILRLMFKDNTAFLFSVLFLSASNAFFDYTSSGLENILGYVVIAFFLYFYFCIFDNNISKSNINFLILLSGLIILVRHDLLLLLLPPVLYTISKNFKLYSRKQWTIIILLSLFPVFLFTCFSVIYYGFPFPNTAYAKINTGIDKIDIFKQGICYFYSSLIHDTITLLVIIVAICISMISCMRHIRYLAYGIILNLLYIIYVGGDFMQGRFLSYSYLISVIIIIANLQRSAVKKIKIFSLIMVLIYSVFYFHTPLNSGFDYKNTEIDMGIADERGFYFQWLSLDEYLFSDLEDNLFRNPGLARDAIRFKSSDKKIIAACNIGIFGYYSGTDKIIIDQYALSDPLLARMPVSGIWRIGHFKRRIPDGYIESILQNKNVIKEKNLNQYYRILKIITQDDQLLSIKRLKTILMFNLNYYDHLLERECYYLIEDD